MNKNHQKSLSVVIHEQNSLNGQSPHLLPINSLKSFKNYLFTGGRDGVIGQFYKKDDTQYDYAHVQIHSDWVNDILPYNDNLIVSCSSDLSIKYWNFDNGDIGVLGYHHDYVECLTESKGKIISGGLDRLINVWDLNKSKKLNSYSNVNEDKGSIYSINANDNLTIAGDNSGSVLIFDNNDYRNPLHVLNDHKSVVKSILITDGYLLTGSSDKFVKKYDLRNVNEPIDSYKFDSAIWSLYSNSNEFQDFYVGDSNGEISYKHSDEPLQIIGKEQRGVLSITSHDDSIWSSSMNDSNLTNWENPTNPTRIQGNPGLIKSRLLNNRRYVVTLSTSNEITLWDILKLCKIKTFNNVDEDGTELEFEDIINKYQTDEILSTWCRISIKSGKLFIILNELNYLNCEVYGDDLKEYEFNVELDKDTRYSLGKIFILSIFQKFLEYEITKDETFRELRLKEVKESSSKSLKILTRFSSNESKAASQPITPVDELKENPLDTAEVSSGLKRLKLFSRKSSTIKTIEESVPIGNPTLSSNTITENEISEDDKSNESSRKASNQENSGISDSMISIVQEMIKTYESTTNFSASTPSLVTPPPSNEVPILTKFSKNLIIIINEKIDLSFNDELIDIYTEFLQDLNYDKLRIYLPKWIGNFLLKNKVSLYKEFNKVGFILLKDKTSEDELPDINENSNIPIRLNAYNMLRIKRILNYITERFPQPTVEMEQNKPIDEWLEILCHDQVLDNSLTLATIRSFIWKSSGDVVLTYRRIKT